MSVLEINSLRDTILWKKLDSGFNGLDSNIARSLAVNTLVISEEAYQRMKAFPALHPQYTLHDETHLLRVTELMAKVLGETGIDMLNPIEVALLILAAYYHDQGMVLSNNEISVLDKDPKYILFRQGWKADHPILSEVQNLLAHNNSDPNVLSNLRRTEHELLTALHTDYIRATHGARSATYILTQYGNDDRWKVSEVNLATLVARLARSHVRPAADLNSTNEFHYDESVGTYTVNMVFLGVILRLADILDFDRDRTPDSLYRSIHFTSPVSLQEWEKHRSVNGWIIDPTTIRFTAYCKHPEYERAIRQYMDWIDAELSACHTLVNSFPKALGHYQLLLPLAVNRDRIGPKDRAYIYHDLEFSLSRDQVVKLLMTDQLYGSPDLCIRELLQNALDAVRLRKALIRRDTEVNWTAGKIKFEHYLDEYGYEIVRCIDNGAGMDEAIITKFLTNVGRSYYRSAEFEQERHSLQQADADFDPIGQFGIGFMSCFMLGDNIRILTKKDYGQGKGYGQSLIIEISGLGGIVTIKEAEADLPIGTTIEIKCSRFEGVLNNFKTKTQVVETISEVAIATEFSISAMCNIPENIGEVIIPSIIYDLLTPQQDYGFKQIITDAFEFSHLNPLLQGYLKESFIINEAGEITISNDEATLLPAEKYTGGNENRRHNPGWIINNKLATTTKRFDPDPVKRICFDGIYVCGETGYKSRKNRLEDPWTRAVQPSRLPIGSGRSTFTLNVRGNLKAPLTPARTPLTLHGHYTTEEWQKLETYVFVAQARIYENLIAQRLGKVKPETYWCLMLFNNVNIRYLRMSEAWQYLAIPCTDKIGNLTWIQLCDLGVLKPILNSYMLCNANGLYCEWKESDLWNSGTRNWYSLSLLHILITFYILDFKDGDYILIPAQPNDPKKLIINNILTKGDYDHASLLSFSSNLQEAITANGIVSNYNINHPVVKFVVNSFERIENSPIELFLLELLESIRYITACITEIKEDMIEETKRLKRLGALYSLVNWDENASELHPPYKTHSREGLWIEIDHTMLSSFE